MRFYGLAACPTEFQKEPDRRPGRRHLSRFSMVVGSRFRRRSYISEFNSDRPELCYRSSTFCPTITNQIETRCHASPPVRHEVSPNWLSWSAIGFHSSLRFDLILSAHRSYQKSSNNCRRRSNLILQEYAWPTPHAFQPDCSIYVPVNWR
jgi:hypothetical protein